MPNVTTRFVLLQLDPGLPPKEMAAIRDNLSAVVLDGPHLWLGGDEGTDVHRMTRDGSGGFAHHVRFNLKEKVGLPGDVKEEIDIEGLDVDGGYLWLVGSHSAKRKKAKDGDSDEKNLENLSRVELDGNRLTLARVPLDGTSTPVASHGGLTAARLRGDSTSNLLMDALRSDEHLGRFVPHVVPSPGPGPSKRAEGIPSKENGLDIEGLAVTGDRVFLGLRGPVLRGWAVILEFRVSVAPDGSLSLATFGSGRPYLKHLLALDGLGVRDIAIVGDDLLVLAGPSMALDGPSFVYRWADALSRRADSLVSKTGLERVVTVPSGTGTNRPEGLTLVTESPLSMLVCFDSPDPYRIVGPAGNGVTADVFEVA